MRCILYTCAFLCLLLSNSFSANAQCIPTTEVCDGKDNDCDGLVDEGFNPTTWYRDFDGDGYGSADTWHATIVSCTQPEQYVSNNLDCSDYNATIYPGAPEICDKADNDCNGLEDDGINVAIYYTDRDGDGYGEEPGYPLTECEAAVSYPIASVAGDCNDNNPNSNPAAPEVCDGLDNNCNGQVDEGFKDVAGYNPVIWHRDWDGDGHGATYDYEPAISSCEQPEGYVSSSDDCNDYNPSIYGSAIDVCDGMDNDCDGLYDEDGGDKKMYYQDNDLDGYGIEPGQLLTECEAYYASYITLLKGDCNDNNWEIHPGAVELCDAIDNNCDGQVDEGFKDMEGYNPITWYRDEDGDGYGAANAHNGIRIISCTQPMGYVVNDLDCNDYYASVYPGAPEICDRMDNDCDGWVDEGMLTYPYYADEDWDGYGAGPAMYLTECEAASLMFISEFDTDCDDRNSLLSPGTPELCDGIDNNCNGLIDEGFKDAPDYNPQMWYFDADRDGYGNAYSYNPPIQSCTQPVDGGYVTNSWDCNDWDAAIFPGAPEICDHKDNDCDGLIDEGFPRKLYYFDQDGDGYGGREVYYSQCEIEYYFPESYKVLGGDCNDEEPYINPAAIEVCDGIDNDCDGLVDEKCINETIISVGDVNVYESEGFANVTISLLKPTTRDITVSYTTIDGTASSKSKHKTPADYVAQKGTVTLPAGTLSKTIQIPIKNDGIAEGNEWFTLLLSKPRNAAILDGTATITLIEYETFKQNPKAIGAPIEQAEQQLRAKAFPNPSQNHFTLQIQSKAGEKINIRVVDALGRTVESRVNLAANNSLTLGHNYKPGLYYAEIVQGNEKVTLRLVKQ